MIKYPNTLIDWNLLAQAALFYSQAGFIQTETPYALEEKYHAYTKPHKERSFILSDGIFFNEPHELVGSAEQGFIYLLLNNFIEPDSRLFSITPCFRCDNYDLLHQPWFMKLELFHYSNKEEDLLNMLNIAKIFFESHIHSVVNILKTGVNMYDLEVNNIEVASFGFRTVEDITFIYGTGLALPRFSLANQLVHSINVAS